MTSRTVGLVGITLVGAFAGISGAAVDFTASLYRTRFRGLHRAVAEPATLGKVPQRTERPARGR
jgi:hypothetical protein